MKGISGTPQPRQPTTNADAWLGGHYTTFRLVSDVEAVKVYVVAVFGRGRETSGGATRSNGRWFAVGDVILMRAAPTSASSLWSNFARIDWCRLKAGSIVNVGRCSPLFTPMGGGEQVEWISGPQPEQLTTAAP
jgi:hypothetical protein